MMKVKPNTFVLSLGGSIFAPNGKQKGIDIDYLHKFEKFIRQQVAKKRRFFIVTGGGYTAREYRDAAAKAAGKQDIADEDLDWLGVHATRLNAHLFRTIFRDIAHPYILKHYDLIDKKAITPVVICAGWKPGWSSDYCAVMAANDYGIKTVINLSNIDYVFDKDPHKYKTAKRIEKMSWNEMIKIVGKKWEPGLNAPFDPVACRAAKEMKVKVVVCNGRNFKNVEKVLEGKEFKGTIIE